MTEAELVDVVDHRDHVIGVLPRDRLAAARANHRVVHVLLFDQRGDVVLQRPSAHLQRPFVYGSSVAGHVHAGESYLAAAQRETSEELGVIIADLEPLGTTWLDEDGRRKFIGVFVGSAPTLLRPDPGEVAAVERMSPREVRRILREAPSTFSATFARVFRFADDLRGFT